MLVGCRNGVNPPEMPTVPDYEITVEVSEGKEGIDLALQTLADLGGGTLTLSEGTFIIDGPINLISNMVLQGQGENTVIKLADNFNANTSIIRGNGVFNVLIRNLVIDGNKAQQTSGTQHGIYLSNSENIKIENVTIKNCRDYGLNLQGSISGCVADKVSIYYNEIGVRLLANSSIINSVIAENEFSGIHCYDAINTTISNCKIYNNGAGIYNNEYGIYVKDSENLIIMANYIYGNNSDGIYLDGGLKNKISKNKIYQNNDDGMTLDALQKSEVEGNEIYDNTGIGVFITYSENNIICANTLEGNVSVVGEFSGVMLVSSLNNTMQSNKIRGNAAYGIWLWGGCSGNKIFDNDLVSSGAFAAIRDQGSNNKYEPGNYVNDGSWIVGPDYTP